MIQNEMKNFVKYTSIGLLSSVIFFGFSTPILAQNNTSKTIENHSTILVGAENTANYLSKLKGKKVRVKKVKGIDYVLTNSLVNVSSNFPKNW